MENVPSHLDSDSIEHALQKLSPEYQERVKTLVPFQDTLSTAVLYLMAWETFEKSLAFVSELKSVGLATWSENGFSLNPELRPYLKARMTEAELEARIAEWQEVMLWFVYSLQEHLNNTEYVTERTLQELPCLLALLERVEVIEDPIITAELARDLLELIKNIYDPPVKERIILARDRAEQVLRSTPWNHAAFQSQQTRIEQQLQNQQIPQSPARAHFLLNRARLVGENAYEGADYDLAMANYLMGVILKTTGKFFESLGFLEHAERSFEELERRQPGCGAAQMVSAAITELTDSAWGWNRWETLPRHQSRMLEHGKRQNNLRHIAVGSYQFGRQLHNHHQFPLALATYEEAIKTYTELGEPNAQAVVWYYIGCLHEATDNLAAAEEAYLTSLRLMTEKGSLVAPAERLRQLGLYSGTNPNAHGLLFQQRWERYVALGDKASEGLVRNNLANTLRNQRRFAEAREQAYKSLECTAPFGLTSTPWSAVCMPANTWHIIQEIENAEGNVEAALRARQKAMELYLAYRREGGEGRDPAQGFCQSLIPTLQELSRSDNRVPTPEDLALLLEQWRSTNPTWTPLLLALQRVIDGERDPSLAEEPGSNTMRVLRFSYSWMNWLLFRPIL